MELMCYNASISVHVTYFLLGFFFGCTAGKSDDSVIQISSLSPPGQTRQTHFRLLGSTTRLNQLKQCLPDGFLFKLSVLLTSPDTNLAHNGLFPEIDIWRIFCNRQPRLKLPESGYPEIISVFTCFATNS